MNKIFLIIAIILISSPVFAAGITRSLPATASPGDVIEVTLTVQYVDPLPSNPITGLDEYAPNNWLIKNGFSGSSISNNLISFIGLNQLFPSTTLKYNISIPNNTAYGTYNFSGFGNVGNSTTFQVTGNTTIMIVQRTAPTQEIVNDTTGPTIAFISPTDNNNAAVSRNWTSISTTVSDAISNISACYLHWRYARGTTDYTLINSMTITGTGKTVTCSYNRTENTTDGLYNYTIWATDSLANSASSETRFITFNTTTDNTSANTTNNTTQNKSSNNAGTNATASVPGSVTRLMPLLVTAGSNITVKLSLTPRSSKFFSLNEIVPSGFVVKNITTNNALCNLDIYCFGIDSIPEAIYYTVMVPSNATGYYKLSGTFQMQGMSNASTIGGENTINIISNIPPAADFSLQLSSASLTTTRLQNKTASLTLSTINGYNRLVMIAISGIPQNTNMTINQTNISLSQSTVIPIGISTINTQTGTYDVMFNVSDGQISHTTNLSLIVTTASSCGNSVCETSESCETCPQDCTCTQTRISTMLDKANLSASNIKAGSSVFWNISKPGDIKILYVNLTTKTNHNNATINIERIAEPNPKIPTAFEYYNFTSSIANENIDSLKIGFAVSKSWLLAHNLNANNTMFYNYLSSWGNVFTKKIGEDNNYINFEASPYGFYPSAIGTKACPVCRDPGAWSDCIGTKQSRTKYICDESTSYECVLQSESRTCCGCTSGEWSSCSNGIKTRTTYDCNSQTGFQCSPKQESETCISDTSQQTAQNAIASAETAISNAKNNKKDTSLAKTYLSQAENFMATNDYTNAFTWANKAKEAADTAPDISSPAFIFPVPIEYLIIIIVAVVGSVAGFFVFRKIKFKIPTSSSKCIVCNNPTQMKFVCTSCKNNACFKDSRVYQGNIYCINCLKKMGFK